MPTKHPLSRPVFMSNNWLQKKGDTDTGVHIPTFLVVPTRLPSATQIFVKHPKSSTAQRQQQEECYSLLNAVETIQKK